MPDAFVRLLPLPLPVRGVVLPNDDGTFDIYINANLSGPQQQAALAHELKHIKKNHLYDVNPVWVNEAEAG